MEMYTQKGGTVENIFTGEPAELNANELSMYDFIMGATMVLERTGFASRKLANEHRKGLDWFMISYRFSVYDTIRLNHLSTKVLNGLTRLKLGSEESTLKP